jgi:hypothetical protein
MQPGAKPTTTAHLSVWSTHALQHRSQVSSHRATITTITTILLLLLQLTLLLSGRALAPATVVCGVVGCWG